MNYIKSLAKQLASKGVRVNGVTPGPVWTPLQNSGGAPEQKYEKFGNTTVFGRQPAELASIYVQLAAAEPALPPETSTVPAADRVNREASLTRRCSHATHKRSSRPRGSTAGAKASRLHKCYRGGNHLPRAVSHWEATNKETTMLRTRLFPVALISALLLSAAAFAQGGGGGGSGGGGSGSGAGGGAGGGASAGSGGATGSSSPGSTSGSGTTNSGTSGTIGSGTNPSGTPGTNPNSNTTANPNDPNNMNRQNRPR
jgi:hypothetical protein